MNIVHEDAPFFVTAEPAQRGRKRTVLYVYKMQGIAMAHSVCVATIDLPLPQALTKAFAEIARRKAENV